MAKLRFIYATMGAGKSAQLLQTNFNYEERGMKCLLLTAAIDNRYGEGKITSRLGLSAPALTFTPEDNLLERFIYQAAIDKRAAVLVDEAQFLTREQVLQLGIAVDTFNLPVMAYGLRTDFRGELFEGSSALMALSDVLVEMRTICHCGSAATLVARKGPDGLATLDGNQVQIGGNDTYVPLCRKHWHEEQARANEIRAARLAAE